MRTFAQKIKAERKKREMTQTEFGQLLGVSQRMILDYETAGRRPHRAKMTAFAETLKVPYEYLADDRYDSVAAVLNRAMDAGTVQPEPEKPPQEESSQSEAEARARREMAFLKERSAALFAGGELPQEAKEAFFQSLYEAYLKCREQAIANGVDVEQYDY